MIGSSILSISEQGSLVDNDRDVTALSGREGIARATFERNQVKTGDGFIGDDACFVQCSVGNDGWWSLVDLSRSRTSEQNSNPSIHGKYDVPSILRLSGEYLPALPLSAPSSGDDDDVVRS